MRYCAKFSRRWWRSPHSCRLSQSSRYLIIKLDVQYKERESENIPNLCMNYVLVPDKHPKTDARQCFQYWFELLKICHHLDIWILYIDNSSWRLRLGIIQLKFTQMFPLESWITICGDYTSCYIKQFGCASPERLVSIKGDVIRIRTRCSTITE